MNTGTKRSHQREAIILYLKGRKDHPTAEKIYTDLKEEMPNLSLGTVYRNLSLLSDTGQINKLSFAGKTDHFDADTSPHYHVLCEKCGAVEDLNMPYDYSMDENAGNLYEGIITSHSTVFTGICTNCCRNGEII